MTEQLCPSQGVPPPAAGEVAELVAKLCRLARQNSLGIADPTITRAAELLALQQQVADLASDAVSALRYIEQSHGRLYGVGFDRVYEKADRLLPTP